MRTAIQKFSEAPDGTQTVNASGEPPNFRIKDASAAYESFRKMRDDDEKSSLNRASIQDMLDGASPYEEADLVETGQADRSNLNFDEAGGTVEYALSGYVDLFNSTENFLSIKMLPSSYEQAEQLRHEAAWTSEFTAMLREWPSFFSRFLACCHHFVVDGIGVCYFHDHVDWRFEVARLGEFYLPRMTKADPGEVDLAAAVRSYKASTLWGFIRNEDAAAAMGWDVSQVKSLLVQVAAGNTFGGQRYSNWEELQVELKNNDLLLDTSSAGGNIKVVHMWVKEYSQKWSQFMFVDSPDAKVFLYKKLERYPESRPPFIIFPYGIGTNGYYHSVRGLGWKIFPHIQLSNRLRNQVVDAAMLSSSLLLQPQDEQSLNELALTYYGPYAVIPPSSKVVERTIPNLTQVAMPVINELSSLLQAKTGQYSSMGVFADGKERSRFEVEAYVARASKLSITSLNLFYGPFQMLMREILRRVVLPEYGANLGGGSFVQELKKRLLRAGVPEDSFNKVDVGKCVVVRAVGGGSAEARQMILNDLATLAPALDEVGRRNLLRDQVASKVGHDLVDRYVPPSLDSRTTVEDKLALMENEALVSGQAIPVLSNESHITHLPRHVNRMQQLADAIESGQMDIVQALQPLLTLHSHAVEHIKMGGSDPAVAGQMASYRQSLQQFGEFIYNGQERAKKLRRAEEAGAAAAGQDLSTAPRGITPDMEQTLARHRLELQIMQEKHEMKQRLVLADAQTKRNLADAEAAAKLARLGV